LDGNRGQNNIDLTTKQIRGDERKEIAQIVQSDFKGSSKGFRDAMKGRGLGSGSSKQQNDAMEFLQDLIAERPEGIQEIKSIIRKHHLTNSNDVEEVATEEPGSSD